MRLRRTVITRVCAMSRQQLRHMRCVVANESKEAVVVNRPKPSLKPGEVLVAVKATALNRADTLQRRGAYPPPPGESDILGLECAGEVVEVGPGCTTRFEGGTRVMALLGSGGYAEYVAVPEGQLMRVPDSMSDMEAAAIPETWLTAFQLLHHVAKLTAQDKVLIHAGGSGVALAAIQLVKAAGATCYITAGSQAKLDFGRGLGAAAGFNYKEGDWAAQMKEALPQGVDVILDPIGGSYVAQNLQAIAEDGRWVLFGLMGGVKFDAPLLVKLLQKRIRIEGTTLRARELEYKASLTSAFWNIAEEKFESGEFKPVIDKVFQLDQVQEAHHYMESDSSNGKIILQIQ